MAAARAAAGAEATSLDEEVVETVAETVTEAPVGTTRRLRSVDSTRYPTLRCKGSGWSCRGLVVEEQAPEEQAQKSKLREGCRREVFLHAENQQTFIHPRWECPVFRFTATDHEMHCAQCYCSVTFC
jgi:hypothetical protein